MNPALRNREMLRSKRGKEHGDHPRSIHTNQECIPHTAQPHTGTRGPSSYLAGPAVCGLQPRSAGACGGRCAGGCAAAHPGMPGPPGGPSWWLPERAEPILAPISFCQQSMQVYIYKYHESATAGMRQG